MVKTIRTPLLFRVIVALAAVGLLPIAITYFQLRSNKDALASQVEHTNIATSLAAATQVDTYLEGLLSLAKSTASHPVLLDSPRSATAQELLRGILVAQPAVIVVGIFNSAGETVVKAQRRDLKDEIGTLSETADEPLSVVQGATQRWLRVRAALPQDAGQLILVADAEPLDEMVQAFQIGEEAKLALASRGGEVLFGGVRTLETFPAAVVEQARSGKLGSGSGEFETREGNVIVGYAELENAPWFVLSRQPARVAKVAQARIQRTAWISALVAILLTAAISGGAYATVIRPLRRLAEAQSQLIGEPAAAAGSEIDQLEASFELLQQRIRDSEDLGKVFLGRYQVTQLLGSGAMGSVFQGWDPKLKRELALKTMRMDSEDIDQHKLISSLMDEAAISARFHHPNIVTVYDVAEQGSAAFIAMELVNGTNLEKYLQTNGPLDPRQVIPLGAAIARALATAHDHDLVHHDVKPANVLLGLDGSIKVTDFGISELISKATTSDDVICGTPGYIAPECFLGEAYTPRADLFALGLILYEALVGKHPFQGRTLRETILNTAITEPEPAETFQPDMPPELAELIAALMAKEPADRPKDAATVAEQLAALVRAQSLEWSPSSFEGAAPDPNRSSERTQLITLPEKG